LVAPGSARGQLDRWRASVDESALPLNSRTVGREIDMPRNGADCASHRANLMHARLAVAATGVINPAQ
jgi:hypothetical protein